MILITSLNLPEGVKYGTLTYNLTSDLWVLKSKVSARDLDGWYRITVLLLKTLYNTLYQIVFTSYSTGSNVK